MIIRWLGFSSIDMAIFPTFDSVKEWWESVFNVRHTRHKYLASLIMLTTWEI
jgi:hypothetical protein